MQVKSKTLVRLIAFGVAGLAVVGIAAAAMPRVQGWLKPAAGEGTTATPREAAAELDTTRDTIRLPADVAGKLGIQTVAAKKATAGRPLRMDGSLGLDPDWVHRARARFPGEIVQVAQVAAGRGKSGETTFRPLRVGDQVARNELLAVVWSKDLGEKKSELVDALLQLRLDTEVLKRYEESSGSLPWRTVEDARRKVESDRIAVDRAERTLRVWRVPDTEMEQIRRETERLYQRRSTDGDGKKEKEKGKGGNAPAAAQEKETDWARVEVRAPFAGTVVERNVAQGDIVDTATDLFKIVNLETLLVQANAYEEALPALLALKADAEKAGQSVHWKIRLKADPNAPAMDGTIDEVRHILDPSTQTVFVVGHVDNPDRRLRAGQFVTATVDLPPPRGMVAIPASALVEDGSQSIVFVQPDPSKPEFTMQRVLVGQRLSDRIFVRSELEAKDQRLSEDEKRLGLLRPQPLRDGQHVVTSGAVELKAEVEDLQSKVASK